MGYRLLAALGQELADLGALQDRRRFRMPERELLQAGCDVVDHGIFFIFFQHGEYD